MQQEVKENKRFKISDRNLSSDKLFANPTVQPTVGAGGQYSVRVQEQPKNSWEKLSESLAGMNAALGAIAQSDIAASELSQQMEADQSVEESKRLYQESKDLENGLYKANGFVDRLTRTGKASIIENPMTFSRARASYGARVAQEEYQGELNKRLLEAKRIAKNNPEAGYNPEAIQKGLMDEMRSEYGLDDGGSAANAFDRSVKAFNKNTLAREFDEATKISQAHGTIALAPVFKNYAELLDNGASQLELDEAMEKIQQAGAGLGNTHIKKALEMYGMEAALDGDLKSLGNFLEWAKESNSKFGGYAIGSPAYADSLTKIEGLLDRAMKEGEDEGAMKQSNVVRKYNNINTVINSQDDDAFSLDDDYGIEGLNLATNKQQALEILDNHFRSLSKEGGFPQRIDAEIIKNSESWKNKRIAEEDTRENKMRGDVNTAMQSTPERVNNEVAIKMATSANEDDRSRVIQLEKEEVARTSEMHSIYQQARDDYPAGSERVVDADGKEVKWSDLDDPQQTQIVKDAVTEAYKRSNARIGDIESQWASEDRQKRQDDFNKKTEESKNTEFESTYERFKLPAGVGKVSQYLDVNLAKAYKGDGQMDKYIAERMPKDVKLQDLLKINKAIKGGSYQKTQSRYGTIGGYGGSTVTVEELYTDEEVKNLESLADELNKRTPISYKELVNGNKDGGGYLPSRSFYLTSDTIDGLWIEDDSVSDEDMLQELQKYDPSLSLADVNKFKRKKSK